MTRQLPGPHHCVSLGISEAVNVFKFLKETCEQTNSDINRAEIDALMQKYLMRMSRELKKYYSSNSKCYASIDGKGTIFNLNRLTHLLLTEWMLPTINKTFVMQTRDSAKNWSEFFTHGLINFADQNTGFDLTANIAKRYNTLAFTKSGKITIEECLHDEGIHAVLCAFMKNFRPALSNDQVMEQLTKFLNKEIDTRFNSRGPNRLHINNKEMTIFFQKIMSQVPMAA